MTRAIASWRYLRLAHAVTLRHPRRPLTRVLVTTIIVTRVLVKGGTMLPKPRSHSSPLGRDRASELLNHPRARAADAQPPQPIRLHP